MQRRVPTYRSFVAILAGCGLCACATFGHKTASSEESSDTTVASTDNHVAVSMPRDASAARDDRTAPILKVASVGNVVFPYVYGYPLYPEGDAARGIAALRADNWAGARQGDKEDGDGVVHTFEELPQLGCRFDGIRENANKYVPLSLSCELPAPKALGGYKRPFLGTINAGAKAEQVLKDPTVKQVFLGAFHMTTDDFAGGSGTAYFNTTHGQLGLSFTRKKLTRFVYYFDPNVKGWQNPASWVRP
jgi:hypothetical protein